MKTVSRWAWTKNFPELSKLYKYRQLKELPKILTIFGSKCVIKPWFFDSFTATEPPLTATKITKKVLGLNNEI